MTSLYEKGWARSTSPPPDEEHRLTDEERVRALKIAHQKTQEVMGVGYDVMSEGFFVRARLKGLNDRLYALCWFMRRLKLEEAARCD